VDKARLVAPSSAELGGFLMADDYTATQLLTLFLAAIIPDKGF